VQNTAHNKIIKQKLETLRLKDPEPLQYISHKNIFVRKDMEDCEPAEYYTQSTQIMNR